jgi:tight adherence protein C
MELTLILLAIFLAAAIFLAGRRFYVRPGQVREQIERPLPGSGFDPRLIDRRALHAVALDWLESLGRKLKPTGKATAAIRERLNNAGYRRETDLAVFFAVRLLTAGCFVAIVLIATLGVEIQPPFNYLIPAFALVIGYILPGVALDKLAKARRNSMRLALPDALDLLTVCVEAGLGFDQALLRVTRELKHVYPQLSDEFALVSLEMNAGKRRAQALRHLADRTGVPEVTKLVAVLIQTDRFGTSLAESLRTHSDYMRVSRRQQAEERANKVGVKLVFPIFFFILPAMMIVVAGPGLLQVVQQMIPMMKQFQMH